VSVRKLAGCLCLNRAFVTLSFSDSLLLVMAIAVFDKVSKREVQVCKPVVQ
jgi:hypothetical protein